MSARSDRIEAKTLMKISGEDKMHSLKLYRNYTNKPEHSHGFLKFLLLSFVLRFYGQISKA